MGYENADRDVAGLTLPSWGRVLPAEVPGGWLLMMPDGTPVEPVRVFLREFAARGNSAGSCRSYAYALHRWWRFLLAVEVEWDRATSVEVLDFVLWFQQATKPRQAARTASLATAGQINPVTRKQHLNDRYQPRTIRHSNAVLRSFYDYWIECGEGPLINPVVREQPRGGRPFAHHNPSLGFRLEGRLRYNPKVPRQRPRAMSDERWDELFAAMPSNRDKAILALAVSTAARAGELLGMRGGDLDWSDQTIRVCRKGSGAQQWLPASGEAFVWLRLYLKDVHGAGAGDWLWQTLRRRRGPDGRSGRARLRYDALRAVLRRANALLGANWSMHDLRHTCAIRMIRDPGLSLVDVQTILGHVHLSTTQLYLEDHPDEVIRRVREHLSGRGHAAPLDLRAASGYNPSDLSMLFGGGSR